MCDYSHHGRLGTSLRRLTDWPSTQKAAFSCRYSRLFDVWGDLESPDMWIKQELTENSLSIWDTARPWAPQRLVQDNKTLVSQQVRILHK